MGDTSKMRMADALERIADALEALVEAQKPATEAPAINKPVVPNPNN